MAYAKKNYRKPYRPRTQAKKKTKRRSNRGGQPSGGMPGMPNGKVIKMRYADPVQYQNSPTGSHTIQTYMINSIYDPDVTNTGTQPLSHDQYAIFYNLYMVVGAKATTTFRWQLAAEDETQPYYPAVCFAFTDEDTTAPTSLQTKMERYPNKYKILNPGNNNTVTIVNYYSANKFFKVNNVEDNHQLRADFASNPQRPAYLNVVVQSLDTGTDCGYVLTTTTIEYMVKLIDPIPILGS